MARSTLGLSAVLLILLGLAADPSAGSVLDPAAVLGQDGKDGAQGRGAADAPPLRIPRGPEWDPIEVPRDEQLDYVVEIDVGILGDLSVGKVTLSSGLEPYNPGLPASGGTVPPEAPRWVGWIRSQARGSYLGYELKHDLDVRHLPQPWPSVFYRDTQAGSENRRRELKLGVLDGKLTALFRSDGHCSGCSNPEHFVESAWLWGKPYHCKKCKRAEHRVWDSSVSRTIPPGTVDLLSAVYLARAMVRDGRDKSTFPVIDKQKLWVLTVSRGRRRDIETPAGHFACVLVQLQTEIPPGEPRDKKEFEGLFGIQGSIRIWMDAKTGVPVMISGDLPVPVIKTLDLNIKLCSYRGTPARFAPKR